MSNLFKRIAGIVYVQQKGDVIQIGGMAAQNLARDIRDTWGTSKINTHMFTDFGRRSLEFPLFYALEVHYMLQTLLKNRRNWTSRKVILSAIRELEEKTWLANLGEDKEYSQILDRSKLSLFHKTPLDHQTRFFDRYEVGRAQLGLNGYLLAAAPGAGKAQPLDAKIKIPGGWTTMGDVRVGDTITAWDGTPTKVTGAFPQGKKDVFEVSFKDGRKVRCCGEHLWRVYDNHFKSDHPRYMEVIDTKTLQSRIGSYRRNHIDLIEPEDGPAKDLPLDPYLLGVLIGDGSMSVGSIAVTKTDDEIYDLIEPRLPEGVSLVVNVNDSRCQSKYITKNEGVRHNPLMETLRRMGLYGKKSYEKFIPDIYQEGSLQQRLDLLRGLFDTDGTVDKNKGTASYCTSSEELALAVQRLLWSVGAIVKISVKQPSYSYLGVKRSGRLAYIVNVRMKDPGLLFNLSRKKALTKDNNQYASRLKLEVASVEKVDVAECQCISIDHPDRLYVTNDFIVTHNTLTNLMVAEMVDSDYVVIVSPNNAVYRVWDAALKKEYKQPREAWIASEGKPYKNQRFLICHYEALEKMLAEVKRLRGKITVVLDECHNFNEMRSLRTQLFIKLCEQSQSQNIIWASGTPIKALGGESVPLLKTIDPLFTGQVEESFKKVFGINARRALDILRNRMGFINYRVEKSEFRDEKPTTKELKVKIPNGKDYTVEAVRGRMMEFINERMEYYKKNYKSYEETYLDALKKFESQLTTSEQKSQFREYRRMVEVVKQNPDPRFTGFEMKFCNNYEKTQIMSVLSNEDKKKFRSAKSVIKYVQLKVMGEALGGILGRARTQVHVDMLAHIDFEKLMHEAEKKTVVFTSYVEVVKELDRLLQAKGLKPMLVFGETNKNLTENIGEFEKDEQVDPLIATYPSLSTAVPLVMADLAILLNSPFRSHEMVQAKARLDRLGQDTPVKFIHVFLDTGEDPNISTRSKDILEWSRAQVAAILGTDYTDEVKEVYAGYEASLESLESPQVVQDFERVLSEILD